jgi:CheY-like chemotaxis protein
MHVLLVDDDRIFNLLSSKVLEQMGIINEIHIAVNGKEAIDLINDYFQGSKTLPDIILLDLNMPIMDGFGFIEAFQKLKLNGKEGVKIIIVTSSQDPADVERARAMGVSGYLTKPITQAALLDAISSSGKK